MTESKKFFNLKYWDERLYPAPASRDPVVGFLERMGELIGPGMSVLDIGAGAGERSLYDYKSKCERMVGVDVDPRVVDNPLLHEGVQANANSLPFQDNQFDLAFSVYVLEHVDQPEVFCREVARVLKPGGQYWSITPNKIHYVPMVAALTPTRFHKWLNSKRGRDTEDTFPTCYKLNSKKDLRHHFGNVGMAEVEISMVEVRPNYLAFTLPTFLIGAAYERVVNATELLSGFRVNFVCGFQKQKN